MTTIEAIGYIGYIAGAVAVFINRSSKEAQKTKDNNLKDLKDRVEILENERKESREQHLENQKAIANLEGQLSTYKEIPLKSIAKSLESLPVLAESNDKILKTLEHTAKVTTEISKTQAKAVLEVKEDLANSNPLPVEVIE
jgi:uncharacterized membrane-anchored protein YhcB (DUF1043 family)